MRGIIYHHFYTFSFFLIFVLSILFHPGITIDVNTLSSRKALTISSNQTIVSPGEIFELGFFKPSESSRWYLGIWYKTIPERTYVWVANRDKPLSNSNGALKFSGTNLVLLDQSNSPVWSTNLTRRNVTSPVVAELLGNGNFVLRYSTNNNNQSGFLWQSFDFPTDTLLPEMKLGSEYKTGLKRFLISWRSFDDPSSGNYSCILHHKVLPEFIIYYNGAVFYRSGPWDGYQFSGTQFMRQSSNLVNQFTENSEEVFYKFRMTNSNSYTRLTLDMYGVLQQFTSSTRSLRWFLTAYSANDNCDRYDICGPYSYCDTSTLPVCNCIKGFDPLRLESLDMAGQALGCVRRTPLSCQGDDFTLLREVKLPTYREVIVERGIGLKDCKKMCLKNCNCTAFAEIQKGGSGCVMWTAVLLDLRNFAIGGGQNLHVRLAAADVDKENNNNNNNNRKIVGSIVGVSVLLFLSFIMFCFWKWKQKRAPNDNLEGSPDEQMDGTVTEDLELPYTDFEVLVSATKNFSDSNKLGEGGFGAVYKGRLPNGQELAVKRLSDMSCQGIDEFKMEVTVISRLQHINLVRILGCSAHEKERLLIYEYLENLSLDRHLFDKKKRKKLDGHIRIDIACGIARGISYLHHESRCKVIHRDLKATNILLDKNMIPKISDFGMARIFSDDNKPAVTRRIVGTHGYMSPEYAMDGIYSEKSDVFSFGVLLIEILTGKKNKGCFNTDQDSNLLSHVWRKVREGKMLEVADPKTTFRLDDYARCIRIALVCVQENAEDRPTMLSVVKMLGSYSEVIPASKPPPGYCIGRTGCDTDASSSITTVLGVTRSRHKSR